MKKIKRALSLVLVFCMLCTMTVTGFAADTTSGGQTDFMKVVHLDAGRKYFSVANIKKIIDNASADGYNYLELGVGNDGLRFLLEDMSVKVEGKTYYSDDVTKAIQQGNVTYNNTFNTTINGYHYPYTTDTNELTQSEMDEIISYAQSKNISIIPLINSPGHMDAILSAANLLTGTTCSYNGSKRTIDVTNDTAVAFTQALIQKYVDYFAGKGCKYFNMGADEYANDKYDSGSMGFGQLQTKNQYGSFVAYVNQMAAMIKNAGMTPMAFNDGIYYNNDTSSGTFDTDILISYWSKGWPGYTPMSASDLAGKGFKLLNTHGDYYWVLGKSDAQCSAKKASGFNAKSFPGSTIDDPAGAMFCIWCDYPGADSAENVVSKTADTMAAFAKTLPSTSNSGTTTPNKAPTAPTSKTITVPVGGTVTETVSGDYSSITSTEDDNIATVKAEYKTGTSDPKLEAVTSIESGKQYLIVNNRTNTVLTSTSSNDWNHDNNYGLKLDGTASTDNTADLWTVTTSGSGYTVQNTSNDYLTIGQNTASASGNSATLSLSYNNSGYWTISQNSCYLNNLGKSVQAGGYEEKDGNGASTDAGSQWTLYEIVSEAQNVTTLTFTGVAVGTTTAQVGDAKYTIKVVDKAPDGAMTDTSLTMEYWITNRPVTADGATSKTITTDTTGIATEAGAKLSDIAPSTGTQDGSEMIYWKGTRLSSDNKQTAVSDVDRTQSGDDFSYIRNYKGWWQISADGSEWKDVKATDQIVVYYLQKTTVTEEIETQVVDWGVVPHKDYTDDTSYGKQSFVLVDYAVKYQSGDRSPDSFPTEKTQAFHCNSKSSTVQYDSSAQAYYRHIGMIRAQETSDYEVYMITLTPSNDKATKAVAQTTTNATSYSYDGTEKVVWVDDEKDLGNFADSSTHHKDYSVGGDPIVKGLDVYNQQGMLVTYYVRAKVTQDSLKVHYIDKATNEEFYNYGIIVNSGTTFDANIALQAGDNWRGNLSNGTVTNSLGKEQTVSADLSTMPEIGAQYRYSNYKCDEVTRSEDGKDVYLYYTFNNSHSFVADFGEPITISAADLGVDGNSYTWNESKVTGETYGKVTLDKTNHTLTYTPNQILKNVDTMQLTLTDSSTKSSATHNIYIYPASNVMYEESFVKLGDNSDWKATGKAENETQKTEKLGEEGIHGYDKSYDTGFKFSNGSAYQAQLKLAKGQDFVKTQDKATFTFTGTGFDLISECGTDTGIVSVVVKNTDGKTVKSYMVDTYFTGDEKGIISGTGVLDYQVPIVRCTGLEQGTYTVETRGYLTDGSGVVAKTAEETTENNEVSKETVAEVLDDLNIKNVEASQVEATCMDDNSVLLGGTGVEKTAAKSRTARATAATSANVYIDGVRVYNTLNDNNGAKNYKESEQNVKYESVYDYVKNSLDANGSWTEKAMIYTEYDGSTDISSIAEYKQQGPENEVYLAPGCDIAFALKNYKKNDTVQIAMKAVNDSVTVDSDGQCGTDLLESATEMYYKLTPTYDEELDAYVVKIGNDKESGGVLSLSNLKLSSDVTVSSNQALADKIIEEDNTKPAFTPKTFTVSAPADTLKVGRSSVIKVKASTDVAHVYMKVDDEKPIELNANNRNAVANGKTDLYSYSKTIKTRGANARSEGTYEYSIYAVDEAGNQSKSVDFTVTIAK